MQTEDLGLDMLIHVSCHLQPQGTLPQFHSDLCTSATNTDSPRQGPHFSIQLWRKPELDSSSSCRIQGKLAMDKQEGKGCGRLGIHVTPNEYRKENVPIGHLQIKETGRGGTHDK